jgi:hypothetical protein
MTNIKGRAADHGSSVPPDAGQLAHEQAIKRIDRNRRYWITTAIFTLGMLIIAAIWAITEYHNAGGWPTKGFARSSGIHDVWNSWVIYPAMAWVLLTATISPVIHPHKPISESQIKHEMARLAH